MCGINKYILKLSWCLTLDGSFLVEALVRSDTVAGGQYR